MLLNMFAMGHSLHSRVRQEVWKFLYYCWQPTENLFETCNFLIVF